MGSEEWKLRLHRLHVDEIMEEEERVLQLQNRLFIFLKEITKKVFLNSRNSGYRTWNLLNNQ